MTRFRRVAATAALIAAGLVLVGAAAQPASSVVQDGEKNFAGPASMCPGNDWNCVGPEAFPVEQTGEENVIVCIGDTAACANSTQDGVSNKIECVDEKKDVAAAAQSCGPFEQTGANARNEAIFRLTYDNEVGSTQCAVQTGEILQEGETNDFKADYRIVQRTTSGDTQTQEARQSLEVEQEADEKNQSDVDQVQTQKASGDAEEQDQNSGEGFDTGGGCGVVTEPPDCNVPNAGPEDPVTCLSLDQSVGGSENISKLLQDVKQEAETSVDEADQEQGDFDTGSEARVHQEAPDDGKNVDIADQKTEQKLIAPNDGEDADQDQSEDPRCCGVGSQAGGQDNEETINQTVKQEAGDNADQFGSALAVGFSPTGECKADQSVENNEGKAAQSVSSEPCDEIFVASATCVSGGEGGGCDAFPGGEVTLCAPGFELIFDYETGRPECVGGIS